MSPRRAWRSGSSGPAASGPHGPLWRFRGGDKGTVFETPGFNRVCGVAADKNDFLYAGVCMGGGVIRFDGKEGWQRYHVADGLLSDTVYSLHRTPDGSIWAVHGRNTGYSRLDPQTGKWQTLPELQYLENLADGPDGRLYFHYDDAIAWVDPADPVKTARNSRVPAVGDQKVKLDGNLTITGNPEQFSVWCVGRYGPERGPHEQALTRYEPQADRWTLYTWESTGGAMPLTFIGGLNRTPDGALFVHEIPYGGYKLLPGPGGDATAWRMVRYPQFLKDRPTPKNSNDDSALLAQLIPVRWTGGSTWDTLIK